MRHFVLVSVEDAVLDVVFSSLVAVAQRKIRLADGAKSICALLEFFFIFVICNLFSEGGLKTKQINKSTILCPDVSTTPVCEMRV
jgi:hypothetical protein